MKTQRLNRVKTEFMYMNVCMPGFMSMYNFTNLIKHKTCFKNPENSSCIDLVLSNCSRSFQQSNVFKQDSPIFTNL